MEKWCYASTILDIGTKLWADSLTPRPLYYSNQWTRGSVNLRAGIGHCGKETISGPWRESNPGRPARSQSLHRQRYSDYFKWNCSSKENTTYSTPERSRLIRLVQNCVSVRTTAIHTATMTPLWLLHLTVTICSNFGAQRNRFPAAPPPPTHTLCVQSDMLRSTRGNFVPCGFLNAGEGNRPRELAIWCYLLVHYYRGFVLK